jgi:pyruvate-ferredoxin/flavodoxin oxidoreductase
MKDSVVKVWGRRGGEVVKRNIAAIDGAVSGLHEIALPAAADSPHHRRPAVGPEAPDFVQRVTKLILEGHGDRLPVSAFPPDGTWPTGTSRYEKRAIALEIPIWEPDICIQCNRCSLICPHAAIRSLAFEPAAAANAPASFRHVDETYTDELDGLQYVVQVAPDDCTGCGLCVEICPAKDKKQPKRKALNMRDVHEHSAAEREAFAFFTTIPHPERARIPRTIKNVSLLEPLFEFSGACAGCGETPYIRLMTQLFGDRVVIANATGCSSIYGGNLPTTPYTVDARGRGPAWSNSLFEDNAEFGFGMRLGINALVRRAEQLLNQLAHTLPPALVDALKVKVSAADEAAVAKRREQVAALRETLAGRSDLPAGELAHLADYLVPKSVWIVGGDGWAYDIGYGGLDHVLASHLDVNILVLDTEVYSNTGGQQSKATPLGAVAKFAAAGKSTRKKDLGLLAMSYGHVYVASVAMQARANQTLEAFVEAETYPGPSLIIAHSPCIAHGYDMLQSLNQQRRAIDSGAWPMYRYDPRRAAEGEPPLEIDRKGDQLSMREYMQEEPRFRMIELKDPARYNELVAAAERATAERRAFYEQLAEIHPIAEKEVPNE